MADHGCVEARSGAGSRTLAGMSNPKEGDEAAVLAARREAVEARRAEGRQPALLAAYRDLGEAYVEAGRLDEGESALRTSVQQGRTRSDPTELGLSLLALGHAMRARGRADRALLAYTEAAASLAGRDTEAHTQAAEALRGLGSVPGGAR